MRTGLVAIMKNSNSLKQWRLALPKRSVSLCLAATILCSGCGAETYEQRLNATTQYFAYLDTRNQALGSRWSSATIEMRPPLEFKEILANQPAPPADSEETDSTEPTTPEPSQAIDPRQPDYVDLKLPGLEGAWTTEVPVDFENEVVDRPAYLYVLTNYALLQNKEKEAAANFQNELLSRLATTFDKFLNPEDFTTERFPRGKGYIEPKSFTFGTFEPEMPIEGVPYQVQIYLTDSGENQNVILLIIPKNITSRSKLLEQMEYSLETVELLSPQGGGGGGAPQSTNF